MQQLIRALLLLTILILIGVYSFSMIVAFKPLSKTEYETPSYSSY